MFSDAIAIPRARAAITHARLVGVDEAGPRFAVLDEQEAYNLLLDGGRVALHTYIYGTTAQRASAGLGTGFNYIALSNDASAAAAGDTVLAAELTGNGLSRTQGLVLLPTGSGNQTVITHVFTYLGVSPQSVQKVALFDAASVGKMAHEISFTQRTLFTNDTLTIQYTLQAG
jgi:hypothetical protein